VVGGNVDHPIVGRAAAWVAAVTQHEESGRDISVQEKKKKS